jgi:hypothetical protein
MTTIIMSTIATATAMATAIEVRLSGGDDTVVFDNVAHARISYNLAGGGV